MMPVIFMRESGGGGGGEDLSGEKAVWAFVGGGIVVV